MVELVAGLSGFIAGVLFMAWLQRTSDSEGIKAVVRQGHFQAAVEAGRERERILTSEMKERMANEDHNGLRFTGYSPRVKGVRPPAAVSGTRSAGD